MAVSDLGSAMLLAVIFITILCYIFYNIGLERGFRKGFKARDDLRRTLNG